MKALVLISHGSFSQGIKESAEMIMGPQENIYSLSLLPEEGAEDFEKKFVELTDQLDDFVVFADLAGGTPNNVAARQLLEGKQFQLYAGMNLPMVIAFVNGQLLETDMDYLEEAKTNTVNVNEQLGL
ncbi:MULTISPECIES: PTS sugar transporter subunit IIA [Aerococcus]|uniref:PTS fructose transporter subunit IIA n=1 Tax=Aerococcus sanguinicola TaxID=119206 RepID=A0A5N1GGV9_9LACT|nr:MULTISPECIES: PTS fructose transporter subunit IIA [Aerococcus]KAA9300163.1 PTS fructose transporter subunit IIA [Aerococcus sanguinicola]MDK6369505.1 PTS fructose transporter subunit IIA [Aerococcus sp. UMB9870]MDK6679992.1 PTS fructose transporter subunit IIA [Aerococcus sp. UMB8608]MDK6686126.1 PTS fructose transporter subunit IIA [Aerococcus sp. UMB8623]MDK6939906.1 PTS fructose transporter subunit IIA [Aerococcus sp. UMB8487]